MEWHFLLTFYWRWLLVLSIDSEAIWHRKSYIFSHVNDPELNLWQDLGVKPNILLFCLMFARSASALLLRLSGARTSMYCELHEGKRFNSLDTSYLLLHTRLPGEDPPWPSCHGSTGGILTIMWGAGAWRALLWGLCAGACIYNVFCCAEITQSCLLSIQNRLSTRLEIFNIPGIFPSPGPTAQLVRWRVIIDWHLVWLHDYDMSESCSKSEKSRAGRPGRSSRAGG